MPMSVVYTNFGGELVHENRGGVETTYISDPLGSVIECRDASGAQTFSATYWPYGEIRTSTGTNPSQFDFVGALGYYRENANRAYVRARVLRKELARWMTVDPLWPDEAGYGYVSSSPVMFSDSTGTQHELPDFVLPPGSRREYPAPWVPCPTGTPCDAAGITCDQANEAVYLYCKACERDLFNSDCRHVCNALADWYYRACKDPRRTFPAFTKWCSCSIPAKGIVPMYPPPPLGRGKRFYEIKYEECMAKAKGWVEEHLCLRFMIYQGILNCEAVGGG